MAIQSGNRRVNVDGVCALRVCRIPEDDFMRDGGLFFRGGSMYVHHR